MSNTFFFLDMNEFILHKPFNTGLDCPLVRLFICESPLTFQAGSQQCAWSIQADILWFTGNTSNNDLVWKTCVVSKYSRVFSVLCNCTVTSSMARNILVVTPSPSLLTRQLLIGWRLPLRRVIPFCRSASLHTNTLSPENVETQKHEYNSKNNYSKCK